MGVIVDTAIWSLALRRNTPDMNAAIVQPLRSLINNQQVVMLGAIRQEVLSGLRTLEQFDRLRNILRAFPNLDLVAEDDELAAEFFNICRRQGIQGSNTDFLICAAAPTLPQLSNFLYFPQKLDDRHCISQSSPIGLPPTFEGINPKERIARHRDDRRSGKADRYQSLEVPQ
jgi:predicted nucleic acid-binding protein